MVNSLTQALETDRGAGKTQRTGVRRDRADTTSYRAHELSAFSAEEHTINKN